MKYSTQIRNNGKQPISLRNPRNMVGAFMIIPNRRIRTVNFDDDNYFLAPFERVTYHKNGKVSCDERKGYKHPERAFPATMFLNSGGVELECVMLDSSDTVQLPKGIPIYRTVPLFSFYAEMESVEISEPKMVPKLMMMNPHTIQYERKPNFIYKKRSPADLKKLKQMREAAYLRSAGFKTEE